VLVLVLVLLARPVRLAPVALLVPVLQVLQVLRVQRVQRVPWAWPAPPQWAWGR
jgi:hypothetical protein